jgi:hemoglobin
MDETLYQRYGIALVTRVVTRFYAEVLDSPRLRHYFDGVHMQTLVEHQSVFMATAMGGPHAYTTAELRDVHHRLAISHDDFTEMIRLLRSTLERFGIEPADAATVVERYEQTRASIVAVAS